MSDSEPEAISKSQLKRELLALQQLGERLIKLSPEQWRQLGFSAPLLEALEESRRIKGHNAMRRHIRRIGKLLRDEETGRLEALLQGIDQAQLQDTHRLHRLEQWRTRLLEEGDGALEALLQICPDADRQHLRQLVRCALKEQKLQKPPAAYRKIFRYLKELDIN